MFSPVLPVYSNRTVARVSEAAGNLLDLSRELPQQLIDLSFRLISLGGLLHRAAGVARLPVPTKWPLQIPPAKGADTRSTVSHPPGERHSDPYAEAVKAVHELARYSGD